MLIFELMCCSLDGLYAEQLKLGQTGCRQRFMVYAKAIVSVDKGQAESGLVAQHGSLSASETIHKEI